MGDKDTAFFFINKKNEKIFIKKFQITRRYTEKTQRNAEKKLCVTPCLLRVSLCNTANYVTMNISLLLTKLHSDFY